MSLFEHVTPQSQRVQCTVCGRLGLGPTGTPTKAEAYPWQRPCLDGHPFVCSCGRPFATKSQISAHRRHTQHPERES